jgi:hypothetical protein
MQINHSPARAFINSLETRAFFPLIVKTRRFTTFFLNDILYFSHYLLPVSNSIATIRLYKYHKINTLTYVIGPLNKIKNLFASIYKCIIYLPLQGRDWGLRYLHLYLGR